MNQFKPFVKTVFQASVLIVVLGLIFNWPSITVMGSVLLFISIVALIFGVVFGLISNVLDVFSIHDDDEDLWY